KRAVPVFLRLLHETPEVGPVVLPALAKLGSSQAISPVMECLQGTNPVLRTAALRTLATITDAAHAEQVLKAVMAVRDSADAALKEVANDIASALIGKFGAAAVGRSTPSAHAGAMLRPPQTLLHEPRSTEVSSLLGADLPDLTAIVIEGRDIEG